MSPSLAPSPHHESHLCSPKPSLALSKLTGSLYSTGVSSASLAIQQTQMSSLLCSTHFQLKLTSRPYRGDLFRFLIISDMPPVSSLALQGCNLFPSVVKLGKSHGLGWRTMNHEGEAVRSLSFHCFTHESQTAWWDPLPSPEESSSITGDFRNVSGK